MNADGVPQAPGRRAGFELELSVRTTLVALLATSAALAATSLVAAAADHLAGGTLEGARDVIDLNREGSLPTLWSALQLGGAAALCALAAARERSRDGRWTGWALFAAFGLALALDEALALHELATAPVRDVVGSGGVLHYAWVVPGGAVLLVVGLALRRFVRRLSPAARRLVVRGAVVLVLGGYGLELAGGAADAAQRNWLVVALYHLEESLELLGEALIVTGLVSHLAPLRLGLGR